MVSTILKRSVGFSISVLFLFVAMEGSFLSHSKEDNYLLAGIFFAPFVVTLVVGVIISPFRKHSKFKYERVPSILWYSFQYLFDDWCCLALYFLCVLLIFSFGINANYGIAYVIACSFVQWSDSGDNNSNNPDAIESDRISPVKVFLLSLALSPIAGYIAVRMYKSEQSKKTDTMKRHLERAKAYLEAKDYTNAILECQEGLNGTDELGKRREGNFAQRNVRYDILHLLAEIYCEQEKYSEAIEAYRKAMYIFPHDESKARQCVNRIVHPIGQKWAYEDPGATLGALRVVETYGTLFPDDEHFEEERIQLTQHKAMHAEAASCIGSAKAHLKKADYVSAIAECTKAIDLAPNGGPSINKSYCYVKRAEAYFAQENYANAIVDYTKAIELASEDTENDGYFNKADLFGSRAEAYRAQKDYVNAIADYKKAIELAPEDDTYCNKAFYCGELITVYSNRAVAYLEQKNYANAVVDCTKAIELDSTDPNPYKWRARAYLEQKDYANAVADCTKAIELGSTNETLYGRRAEAYLAQENYANAIADYTKAIELAPRDNSYFGKSYYYEERAKVYLAQKDYENAIADYTKAIEVAPETNSLKAHYYISRANTYLELGNTEQAEADLTKAKELDNLRADEP